MAVFKVKVTTRHEGCKRVCKLDVIAECSIDAASRAVHLLAPAGNFSVAVNKAGGKR